MADTATHAKDYLAVINAGGCGSFARGPDKEKAIASALRQFKRDFKNYFKLERGRPINIDVLDVTGHDTITWDDSGYYSKSELPLGAIERVKRTL